MLAIIKQFCRLNMFFILSSFQVKVKVLEGYRLPQPYGCSDDSYLLMVKCWARRPTERPNFADILKNYLEPLAAKLAR